MAVLRRNGKNQVYLLQLLKKSTVPPLKTRTHPRSYSYPRRKLHIASKHQNFIRSKKLAPQEENTYPDSRMVNRAYQDIFPIFFKFLSTSYFVNLQMTCQLLSAYLQL